MTDASYRIANHSPQRIDLTAKLTGQAAFGEDLLPRGGYLYGKVLRSPHAHARILHLDVSAARALPGVRAVITADDLPRVRYGSNLQDEEYFASEVLLFAGQRIAAVAADTLEIAAEALRRIDLRVQTLPPVLSAEAALAPDAPRLHPDLLDYPPSATAKPVGGNVCSKNELHRGDPEAAFAQAAKVFEQDYVTEMVHQAYLEPRVCLGIAEPDGSYTVHASTQGIFPLRNSIATVLGVPQNRVRVEGTEIGGGFGGKISLQDEAAAAALSRAAGGQPVRIVQTRAEDFLSGTPRAKFHMRLKTGVTAEGKLLARTFDIILDQGAFGQGSLLMSSSLPSFAEGPYAIPNLRVTVRAVYTNKPPCSAYRAPGGPQTSFASESEMERIAAAMGWDALEFRRKNLMPEGHRTLAGVELKSVMAEETLDAALEKSGFSSSTAQPGAWRGRGLSLGNWNVGGMPSAAVLKLNDDGSATVLTGTVDLTGVFTAFAQIVAETLALPLEQVTVQHLDTESAPTSSMSAGSQALKSTGTALVQAANQVRDQLFQLAVEDLDVSPERMELAEGHVRVTGEGPGAGNRVSVPSLIARATARSGPILGHGGVGAFDRMPSCCAHVADVEVDPETGQITLQRYVAVQDCGLAINPVNCEGQVAGGAVQGIGMALTEVQQFPHGPLANAGFLDYKIPSALDLPPIEVHLVQRPAVTGPFGAKGIGEPPVVPPPAAIANAVFNATGIRFTHLPITPEAVRRALRKQARQRGAAPAAE